MDLHFHRSTSTDISILSPTLCSPCNSLQLSATLCNSLQLFATLCNSLQLCHPLLLSTYLIILTHFPFIPVFFRTRAIEEERNRMTKLAEEKEIKKMREDMVHKPIPIPNYKPLEIHGSEKPMTIPESPNWSKRNTRNNSKMWSCSRIELLITPSFIYPREINGSHLVSRLIAC